MVYKDDIHQLSYNFISICFLMGSDLFSYITTLVIPREKKIYLMLSIK